MPSAWARAMCSAGTPRWNEMAWGWNSRVAANASSSNGRPVWLMAIGRSVSSASCAHWARISGTDRTAVPTDPRPPALLTAAASATWSHGPNGARTRGVSIPRTSQRRVRSISGSFSPPTRHLANPGRPSNKRKQRWGTVVPPARTRRWVTFTDPENARTNAALDPRSTAPDPAHHRPALRHGRAPWRRRVVVRLQGQGFLIVDGGVPAVRKEGTVRPDVDRLPN